MSGYLFFFCDIEFVFGVVMGLSDGKFVLFGGVICVVDYDDGFIEKGCGYIYSICEVLFGVIGIYGFLVFDFNFYICFLDFIIVVEL